MIEPPSLSQLPLNRPPEYIVKAVKAIIVTALMAVRFIESEFVFIIISLMNIGLY